MGKKREPVASEAELNLAVMDTAAALKEQPTRTVKLYQVPKDSTDRPMPDEFVQVNGHGYQIQRGVTVEIPETVYEILEQAGRL